MRVFGLFRVSATVGATAVALLLAVRPGTAAPESAPARLALDALPTAESVELTLDPRRDRYEGRVTIQLDVRRQTSELRFHARALTIDSVAVTGPAGLVAVRAVERLAPDQARVRLAAPADPGAWTLTVDFHNAYNTRAVSLYRVATAGDSYLFTQFEDTEAREAFPCWDEPGFKIPWTLTLTVPAGYLAVSNTPVARETPAGDMKRVEFARTRPLPSYLVVIAVGPFETVPIPGLSVPGRVITVKGTSGLSGEAVGITPGILASLETYFGRPYPYEKLDLIAAPEFLYGAMENAGAVVFADRLLLVDPRSAGPDQRRALTSVVAHELSHMWFGDFVTMQWWDDLWLNESFASWMAAKTLEDVFPLPEPGAAELFATQRALDEDSRPGTGAIRAPIEGSTSLSQLPLNLVYSKGRGVLAMFEGWLGRDTFRSGVLEYLEAHAWGNAVAADLWRALGRVSGENVDAAMATFLDRPGVPLVSVEPLDGGRVRLTQSRFLTGGGAAPDTGFWRIPVTLRYPAPGGSRTQRVWLAGASVVADLGVSPDWIEPNADATGYYRWQVPDSMLDRLAAARAALGWRERTDLVSSLSAGLRAGTLHGDRFLALLGLLADDPSPNVVLSVVRALNATRIALVTPSADSSFAAFLRTTFEPALARFGMRPRPEEDFAIATMRPELLRLLADAGHDLRVLAFAESLNAAYRRDRGSIVPSLAETAVLVGAERGDRTLFEDYRARFETTTIPIERTLYLAGLGSFRDPGLRKAALDYVLSGPLRPQETLSIPAAMAENAMGVGTQTGGGAYSDSTARWVLDHFDAIASHMPPNFKTRILGLLNGCSEERLALVRERFADAAQRKGVGDRRFEELLNSMEECASLNQRESRRVERWLMERAGRP